MKSKKQEELYTLKTLKEIRDVHDGHKWGMHLSVSVYRELTELRGELEELKNKNNRQRQWVKASQIKNPLKYILDTLNSVDEDIDIIISQFEKVK